jgi:hypothetical protein
MSSTNALATLTVLRNIVLSAFCLLRSQACPSQINAQDTGADSLVLHLLSDFSQPSSSASTILKYFVCWFSCNFRLSPPFTILCRFCPFSGSTACFARFYLQQSSYHSLFPVGLVSSRDIDAFPTRLERQGGTVSVIASIILFVNLPKREFLW